MSLTGTTRTLKDVVDHLKSKGFNPHTVIDVGVAWGTEELYYGFPDAYFHLVEPLEYFREQIDKWLLTIRGEAHFFAAGAEDSVKLLSIKKDELSLAGSSLVFNTVSSVDASNSDRIEQEIIVKRLDDILKDHSIKAPCLLKVDAQGYDFTILKNCPLTLSQTEVVIVEANVFPFYKSHSGAPSNQLLDIVHFMSSFGFTLFDIFDPLYRPGDGALAQVDLLFCKEGSKILQNTDW